MAKFSKPVVCPKCGTPCWTSKQLSKFHNCIAPEDRLKKQNAGAPVAPSKP